MGNSTTTAWQEILNGLGKAIMWIIYVVLGTAAKLAFDSRNQPLTKRQLRVKAAMSLIIGTLTAIGCNAGGWQKPGIFIVPLATLVGEEFIGYVVANFKGWMDSLIGRWLRNNKNGNGKAGNN